MEKLKDVELMGLPEGEEPIDVFASNRIEKFILTPNFLVRARRVFKTWYSDLHPLKDMEYAGVNVPLTHRRIWWIIYLSVIAIVLFECHWWGNYLASIGQIASTLGKNPHKIITFFNLVQFFSNFMFWWTIIWLIVGAVAFLWPYTIFRFSGNFYLYSLQPIYPRKRNDALRFIRSVLTQYLKLKEGVKEEKAKVVRKKGGRNAT